MCVSAMYLCVCVCVMVYAFVSECVRLQVIEDVYFIIVFCYH